MRNTRSKSQNIEALKENLPTFLVLGSMILALFVLLKNKSSDKKEESYKHTQTIVQPLEESVAIKSENSSESKRLFFIQNIIGIFFIGVGLIAIWSTKTTTDNSQVQPSFFEVTPRFEGPYTDDEIKAGHDFDIFITITPLPNNRDCSVILSVKPHQIATISGDVFSVNHKVTPLTPPRFTFEWPGYVELSGFTKETMSEYFELLRNETTTTITSKHPNYPLIEFIWYGAIKQAGFFKKRFALNFADRKILNLKVESGEISYKVIILPDIPGNSTITFISPKIDLLAEGILVVKRENMRFDYNYTIANGYFEVEYENQNAANIRELLIIISGIAFGISGNFFANIILDLAKKEKE